MKKILLAFLLCFALIFVVSACNNSDDDTQDSTDGNESSVNESTSDTVNSGEDVSDETTDETTSVTTETTTEDPTAIVEVVFENKLAGNCLTASNQTDANAAKDGKLYALSLLTNVDAANDPYAVFDLSRYLALTKKESISADTYKYVILKMKSVNCTTSAFELFYMAGDVKNPDAKCSVSTNFSNADSEYQYIYFDLSDEEYWNGNVNGFRFDYMFSAQAKGEGVVISSIIFATDYSHTLKAMGEEDISQSGLKPLPKEDQEKVDQLLGGTIANGNYDKYLPEKAEKEDSDLNIWFNHTYTRTPKNEMTPSKYASYRLMLAKNETEACQLILSSISDKKGLKIQVSDFTHANGTSKMDSDVLMGYYFTVNGLEVIDPLPPIEGNFATFDMSANTNQTFVIKAKSTPSTESGEYSATVRILDASGNEIKKVTVFAYVWNFELPENTSCKTLMDIDYMSIYFAYAARYTTEFPEENFYSSDVYNKLADFNPYKAYYDFLLENRICAYTIPDIQSDGVYSHSVMSYMKNPRVVAFLNLGWKTGLNDSNVSNSFNSLNGQTDSLGTSLLDKAYFYPVDEPSSVTQLDAINAAGALISKYYGSNYNLIAPIHLNSEIGSNGNVDYFEYVKDSVTAWCPKTHFYTSYSEYKLNRNLTYQLTTRLEKNLGTFAERMEAQKAGGDETWWYVTRKPSNPELTVLTQQDAVSYRTLFWQQKLYNVDGFLYYSSNDWGVSTDPRGQHNDNHEELVAEYNKTGGWYSKHEISAAQDMDVYGNGVLFYPGHMVDWYHFDPVGSLRLECIRDGIEDYEYFTILEKIYGKDQVDDIISQFTTSLSQYKTDAEYFTALREAIGCLVEASVNK